ncbi:hypothetical protein U9M48_015028 [Paspalum notatum var. saurae]|uniref:BZIP domain-containing protein n=1 Tax=Paspalum notatum var. saurae TaxID=547442 RepID=A0AAQ3T5R5_PASNO
MAAMDLEDDEDIWANAASSPSASPPRPVASAAAVSSFISTQLSLNSRLHLLSSAAAGGGSSPPRRSADGVRSHHMGLGAGPRNAAASPSPFFSYSLDAAAAGMAPLDAPCGGASRGVLGLDDEVCLGPVAAWAGADRRKKRMIKNRESAARSRARKQAHVQELEKEVKHLQQENQSLRDKYEQLRASVEVAVPVKKTLQRMPSAPF